MKTFPGIILFVGLVVAEGAITWDKDHMHPKFHTTDQPKPGHQNDFINPPEDREKTDWHALDKKRIDEAMQRTKRMIELNHPAKNVVLFLGDGMGVSTLSAARIYMAQSRNLTGEEAQLSWERMPHVAMSKTYSADAIIPDSGASGTAMLCGEKTMNGVVALNQDTIWANCSSSVGNELKSILHHFAEQGKWTGIVSTARITHASPACTYAHSPARTWEVDSDLPDEAVEYGCKDIASQLIDEGINQKIRVILGGGRENMLPNNQSDTEYPGEMGKREDGRNLIKVWQDGKAADGLSDDEYKYVDNLQDFNNIDENTVEYLMGLFEPSHMNFELDREEDVFGEPSLADMVEKAIKILKRSPDGYFLFVESGRIDHSHHLNLAQKALAETVVLSDAVQHVLDLTSEEDTLVVVSADHSHTFTLQGYAESHTDILTFDEHTMGTDGKPYAILGYNNGPGYFTHREDGPVLADDMPRMNLTGMKEIMTGKNYTSDASIPKVAETHAGEDVTIFARGPMAHLFHGTQEQSYIGNLMMYASCVGKNQDLCVSNNDICHALAGHAATSRTNLTHMLMCLFVTFSVVKFIHLN